MLLILILMAGDLTKDLDRDGPWKVHEVDVVEYNHVISWNPQDVKWDVDLIQVILWKDVDQGYGFNETCIDWLMIARTDKGLPIYPKYSRAKYGYRFWLDTPRGKQIVKSRLFRTTWTIFDPEREDARIYGERVGLWR